MVGHVDDGVSRGIERAIAAIATAIHLRLRARAHQRHRNSQKNFRFHKFPFTDYCKESSLWALLRKKIPR
jgi:hypothetical protein